MKTASRLLFALPLILIPLAGCTKGNKNANAHVAGKITYKGAPVTGGNMYFFSDTAGTTTIGIHPDGTFEGDSLPVGDITVTIDTEPMKPKPKPKYGSGAGSPPPAGAVQPTGGTYVQIPEKYRKRDTSPLKKKISSGSTTWDMELTD